MLKKIFFRIFLVFPLFFFFGVHIHQILASETEGTVDGTYKYAWGENTGWISFGCDNCDVAITDAGLDGYAWSSRFGWINLNPDNSGVTNTAEGVLSGSAWSSNLGWIDFAGVTINSSGEFLGYATVSSNDSQISFNCVNNSSCGSSDFKVKTDWRPSSSRTSASASGGSSSGSGKSLPVPSVATLPPPPVTLPSVPPPLFTPPVANVVDAASGVTDSFYNFISSFFKPAKPLAEIPKYAPISFQSRWNLLPTKAIREFVFAPLPFEIRQLAAKFPELEATLRDTGIDRFTDADRLSNVTLHVPGLLNELEKTIRDVGLEKLAEVGQLKGITLHVPGALGEGGKVFSGAGAGKIALPKGIPVGAFPSITKRNLPAEFVFARVTNELLDLNVAVSVGDKGQVRQMISTLPGKQLRLVVKPVGPARSVTGYFVFKSATPKVSEEEIERSSLSASAIFSTKGLVEENPEPIFAEARADMENVFVLSSFEYQDDNGDGIYTADVEAPAVPGEYEIITVIDYNDPVLGVRQMRMIAVVDPEGYVFETRGGKETRIPSAIVSLYVLNTATKKYELWDAGGYMQENPQITDVRGTYSFLVPEGSYYLHVEAPGYNSYEGKVFGVREGNGIHKNIELKSGWGPLADIDLETVILVVVVLLLVYNLYSRRMRNKLSNF